MNKEEVINFINQAKFQVNGSNNFARCVDGRYVGDNIGAIAMAGADEELLEAAFSTLNTLNINIPKEKVLEAVLETTRGAHNFHFHTDDHATDTAMGCGHIKHSTSSPEAYNLTTDQAEYIKSILEKLINESAKQTVLTGSHAEKAVVIIKSEKWSARPQLTDGSQVFIYQDTLTTNRLKTLAENLKSAVLPDQAITTDELAAKLKNSFSKHLNETVTRLAAHLPVYTVLISDSGEVTAE